MIKYLLDTNICIFGLRGKYEIKERIKNIGKSNFSISEMTVFELYFGAEKSHNSQKNYEAVDDFIDGLTVLDIYPTVKTYTKEKLKLQKMGKPINDEYDLLIGVCAKHHHLTLITENVKDFKNIENLKTENWIER